MLYYRILFNPRRLILGIAKYIDYTLLKADATSLDIKELCKEAIEYGCASVCVNSVNVPLVAECLKDSKVKVCSVVGFPLGAMDGSMKAKEAQWAVRHGANEIDMVINIGALKDKKNSVVRKEIAKIKKAIGEDVVLKVIIETCLLTDAEKVTACQLALDAKADFVKTSTGFSKGGATVEDVTLMSETVGKNMSVKASGGIRTLKDANELLAAGASRLGCGRDGAKAIIEAESAEA